MGAMRKSRNLIRCSAWLSLLVWICAISYCSTLCLGCAPDQAGTAQPVEYTHEGCEGRPVESNTAGCEDPFCDSVSGAYASFDQFSFQKVSFPVLLDSMVTSLLELSPETLLWRQLPHPISLSPPVVSLDTWNQSHAPLARGSDLIPS